MLAGRPYGALAAVVERSDAVLAALPRPDVDEALSAHPRIGDRPSGDSRESAWSRQEQARAAGAGADVAALLRAGNLAYEERFGQVFLICATGRTSEQILAELTERLGHDLATEQQVVRRELAAIVRLRLQRTLR
jgi:2-oxo-4-hydroxy-4-carboxy-5-ureidoimidazoline decarboxylase